ncbi:MAG TPA: hypothetical protein VHV31_06725 [Nitrolancea sp.]|jgi:hypothetical protein|nr:hypothetical protein [Nitrolancea sp.]
MGELPSSRLTAINPPEDLPTHHNVFGLHARTPPIDIVSGNAEITRMVGRLRTLARDDPAVDRVVIGMASEVAE